MEAMIYPNTIDIEKMVRYHEILDAQGRLKTNKELKDQGLNIDWWPYLQIKSRYIRDCEEFGIEIGLNQLDKLLLGTEEHLISKIYNYLLQYNLAEDIVRGPMIAWARNIGHSIDLEDWEKTWRINQKITKSVVYKENQYKMCYRWYLAPSRLAKMYPNVSPNCWKCQKVHGTFFHMWWLCPKIKNYWNKIRHWIQDIINDQIEMEPEIFLLGIIKKDYKKEDRYLMLHITTAARIALAQCWKGDQLPTDGLIFQKIMDCAEMDRLTLELKEKKVSEYYKVWEKWYEWIHKRSCK